MPRPRKPLAQALVDGSAAHDPKRYRNRRMPRGPALGEPPPWLKPEARDAWQELADNLPWLRISDRCIVGMTASLLGEMRQGRDRSIRRMNLLRQCLGCLGATPADASKIAMPNDPDESAEESFFIRSN